VETSLPDGGEVAAHGRLLTGFHKRRGAEIDGADMGENADAATNVAHRSPTATIFKCVRLSALYIE